MPTDPPQSTPQGDALPLARPLPPNRPWRRLELELADGYRTSVYVHTAQGKAQCLPVVYLHGIQSHPGWFALSAESLARCGHDVFQVTRRGSGDNQADRGHAAGAQQLLHDLDAACRFAAQTAAAPRVHLAGVSWGGKLAAAYLLEAGRKQFVASLTLVAPGICPRVDKPMCAKLAIAGALLACPRRQFEIPLNDPQLFTDDAGMQAYIRGDHCSLRRATARFFYASRCLDRMLRRARAGAIDVPTTLILARQDRIIDNVATRELVGRLTGGRCAIHELPGAHTLEFEADPTPLYDTLAASMVSGVTER